MDPVEIFPAAIIDNIFLHLKGNEIKKCTLVSTAWNEFCGSSLRCMEKLIVNIMFGITNAHIKSLNRNRKYQFVRISGEFESEFGNEWFEIIRSEVYNFLNSNRFWKSVNLSYLEFPTTSSFNNLVAAYEDKVVTASFLYIKINYSDEPVTSFAFQNLKELNVVKSDTICERLFINCSALHSLSLIQLSVEHENNSNTVKYYFDILKRQEKSLKALRLELFSVTKDSLPEQSTFPFELEKLYVDLPWDSVLLNDVFLLQFLRSQRKIKILNLACYIHKNLEVIIAAFENNSINRLVLRSLCGIRQVFSYDDFLLPSNSSIEFLDFGCDPTFQAVSKMLIKAAPNVKALRVYRCDNDLAEFIAENSKYLQKLEVKIIVELEKIELEKILPNVKIVNIRKEWWIKQNTLSLSANDN